MITPPGSASCVLQCFILGHHSFGDCFVILVWWLMGASPRYGVMLLVLTCGCAVYRFVPFFISAVPVSTGN